jgi:hypothetical protein
MQLLSTTLQHPQWRKQQRQQQQASRRPRSGKREADAQSAAVGSRWQAAFRCWAYCCKVLLAGLLQEPLAVFLGLLLVRVSVMP